MAISPGTSAPASRRPKGASGKASTGPSGDRRSYSSTGQAARQSHQHSDEKLPSKPAPASAATCGAGMPGVKARKRRPGEAWRARAAAALQIPVGTLAGDRQRKPATPAPTSTAR